MFPVNHPVRIGKCVTRMNYSQIKNGIVCAVAINVTNKVHTHDYVPLGPSGFDPRLSPTLEVMDHDGATKLATVTGPCC